jgi:hypothetical protein
MRVKFFLATITSVSILMSCDNNSGDSKTAAQSVTTPVNTPATITPSGNQVQVNPGAVSTPVTASTKGVNPPHGEPGHRCDINVGAPLDSKPNQIQTPTVTSTPTVNAAPSITPTVIQQPAPVTASVPGMNPAHGQPGHRCDIAVGAPLNSKPAANLSTTPVKQ